MKTGIKWTTPIAISLFLVALGVVLRWLWSSVYLSEIHSDTVETLFWAAASQEAGAIGSPTFHYGHFIPFGGNLLIQLFLPFFGVGVTALRSGITLFLFLFVFACYRMFRSFRWTRAESLCACAMLLAVAAATPKMREIFFGHVIYYSLGTVFLFFACALAPMQEETDGTPIRKRILRIGSFALCMGWAALCGKPLFLYVVAPILGAWILVRLGESKPLSPVRDSLRILPGIAGAAAGLLVYKALSRTILPISYDVEYEAFSRVATWWDSLSILPRGWLLLIDIPVSNPGETPIVSAVGLPHALLTALGIFLAFFPIASIVRISTFSPRERLLVVAHWILSLETVFFWIFGAISDASWRLCPMVLSASAVCICHVRNGFVRGSLPLRRYSVVIVAVMAVSCSLILLKICALPRDKHMWKGEGTLLPTLESIGVADGYCSNYWFANVATAVSESRFRPREVSLSKSGKWSPRFHNSDERWYEPNPERKQTFLICSPRQERFAPTRGLVGRHECHQKNAWSGHVAPLVVLVYEGDCLRQMLKGPNP